MDHPIGNCAINSYLTITEYIIVIKFSAGRKISYSQVFFLFIINEIFGKKGVFT